MTGTAVLHADNLHVTLAGQPILRDVHLDLRPGELLWITGPNGAGKSTLLRALTGLIPSDGTVRVLGAPPTSLEARRNFVFVPDEAVLYEDLTLREHTHFTGLAYASDLTAARAVGWLEDFELGGRLGEYPTGHSKGMRQKLGLALALGLQRPLTLLDEPYNGLDVAAQQTLSRALLHLLQEGNTVVLSTHQADVAQSLLRAAPRGREAHIHDGRLEDITWTPA